MWLLLMHLKKGVLDDQLAVAKSFLILHGTVLGHIVLIKIPQC